ncbi:Rho termination factor N-terminal domain-containing protein [Clostridium perfringens]|uniref:Rho termination factor N-terminal domain-containing protein n=1 Tax=Clostridium perfringens TaxID=1502 RepID=UPI0022476F2F|nr:Rho termination factor N-terminal domain-containing protein [Clostridium perfringens]MCX0363214.1 Rho termination factor N-terminal domain-containing protein [Clostridium perfringens]
MEIEPKEEILEESNQIDSELSQDGSIELNDKTVEELKKIAKEKNIKGYSTLSKNELIEAIRATK